MAQQCTTLHTRPLLQQVIVVGLRGWLEWQSLDPYLVDATQFHQDAHRLIVHQNAIGWNQLFLGRFATEWSDLQDVFYSRTPRTKEKHKRRTGTTWQVTIISKPWEQWFHLWEMRNQDLHGYDVMTRAAAERREVDRALTEIYDMRVHHMEPSVQALLCTAVEEHYARSTRQNQNWLAMHSPLVTASIRRVRDRAIRGVQSIRQYYGRQ